MATLFNTKISATYPGLIKTIDNAAISATLKQLSDGSGNLSGLFVNTGGDFKVTAILEWGSLKDTGTGVIITQFVTAANGIQNFANDTTIPTSNAVKTYVDAVVTASDLDFKGDSGTGEVDLDSQILEIAGTTNEITTLALNQKLTIGLPNNVIISGTYTGATFLGDLNGTINTATTATTQTAGNNSTKVATTAYVDSLDAASDLDFSGDSGTGDVTLNTQVLAITGTTNQIVTTAANQGLSLSLPATVHRNLQGNVTGNVDGDLTGNVTATSVLLNGVSATTQSSSDSSTKVATTAYVKGLNNASDLDFTTDSGSGAVVLNTETFSVLGTTNQINSAGTGQTITLSLPTTIHRNLLGNVTGDLTGNADTATAWETARSLSVTGEATGTLLNVNGTQPVSGAVTLDNNSVTGKVLTGLPTPAALTVFPTDSILEGIGKLQSQINGIANGLQFQGAWNATSNSPVLVSGGNEAASGTTTGTTSNKLVDSSANFTSTVTVGDKVINQVDRQTALVTGVDSNTILSLASDIMLTNEAYTIDNSPFITQGHYYVVNIGGTHPLNGINSWSVGDWVIAGSTNVWEKLDHTDVEGTGTPGNIAKWLTTGTIADSIMAETGAIINVSGSVATTAALSSAGNFSVNTNKLTANATTGNVAILGDFAINTNKFTVNATSGNAGISGNLSVSGIGSSLNTGNSGTFVTNDSSGYPRITITNSTAQLGLFRSGGSAGGMYIGADSGGLEIMTSSFATKFSLDNSGNGIFTGSVSAVGIQSTAAIEATTAMYTGNGSVGAPSFAFASDLNTGMYRAGSDSIGFATGGSLALTIADNDATFAGNVKINSYLTINGVAAGTSTFQEWKNGGTLFAYTGSAKAIISGGSATDYVAGNTTGETSVILSTNNLARLTIDGDGDASFAGSGTFGDAVRINGTATTGLVIASAVGSSNGLKLYNNSGTDNAYIYNNFNGNLEIGTNNATVLTMNGVSTGIGVAPAASRRLLIKGLGADATTAAFQVNDGNNADIFVLKDDKSATFAGAITSGALTVGSSGTSRFTDTNAFPLQLNRGLDVDSVGANGAVLGIGTIKSGTYKDGLRISGGLETNGTDGNFTLQTLGSGSYTTALSINSSQNATFSGDVKLLGTLELNDVAQSIDFLQSGAINFDSNNDQTGRVLTIGSGRTGGSGGTTNVTFTEDGNSTFAGILGIRVAGDAIPWRGTAQIPAVINLAGNGAVFTRPDVTYLSQNFYYNASDVGAVIDAGKGSLIELTGSGEIKFSNTSEGTSANAAISVVENMRLTSAGELLKGIDSAAGQGTLADFNSSEMGNGYINLCRDDTATIKQIRFGKNGSEVGSISTTGSATSYNESSDYRLKEDLKDFAGLDMVSKIPVYNFKWKTDKSRSYGVMAHELEEVLPQAVTGEKDAEEMQGVDYSKIVPLLVKSIQELTAKVEMLEKNCKCK